MSVMPSLFQRLYAANEPLFSLHIPKCGGQSLRAVLNLWFQEAFYTHSDNELQGTKAVAHSLPPGSVIHGHFSNSDVSVQRCYPQANQFISFIRNPFDIAVSNYFYLKEHSSNWKVRPNIPSSLAAYMEQAVTERFDLVFDFLPQRTVGQRTYEFTRSTFLFVGLVEDYQASIDRLAEVLKKPRVNVPLINPSKRDEDVPNLRDAFRSVYEEEYEFFDLIREEHEQRRTLVASEPHSAARLSVTEHL